MTRPLASSQESTSTSFSAVSTAATTRRVTVAAVASLGVKVAADVFTRADAASPNAVYFRGVDTVGAFTGQFAANGLAKAAVCRIQTIPFLAPHVLENATTVLEYGEYRLAMSNPSSTSRACLEGVALAFAQKQYGNPLGSLVTIFGGAIGAALGALALGAAGYYGYRRLSARKAQPDIEMAPMAQAPPSSDRTPSMTS